MKFFYSFALLFPGKDLETGVFSLDFDFYEGNTDENTQNVIDMVCNNRHWNRKAVRNYAFTRLGENFIEEIAHASGYVRGPGNVGT